MASVWYIGSVNIREVLGYVWSRENQWSIPRESFTESDILILAQDAGFWTNAPDGPRVRSQIPGYNPGTTPNPGDDPVTRMLEILLEARALGVEIDADVIAAAASAAEALGYRNEAEGFKTTAGTSATNAGTSATNAGTSATAANTAKTAAETAKTAAETARTAAQTARTGAETARTGAETALGTATTKATEAEAARANAYLAQQAAEAARDSTVAGTILDNAVTTNKIANKAVTAAKVADATLTGTQMANGGIQTAKLELTARENLLLASNSVQKFYGAVANAPLYMSPESVNSVLIPYYMNDIAFNNLRGGASRIYVDGVLNATDLSTIFTPSSQAVSIASPGVTSIVIEVDLCKNFSYGTKVGYAVNDSWRAKNVKIEYQHNSSATWVTAADVIDTPSGEIVTQFGPTNMNKLKFTFTNFNSAQSFRIGQIFVINYASELGSGPFVDRAGGAIYGNLRIGTGTDVTMTSRFRVGINETVQAGGMQFGLDTYLYRNGNSVLRTNGVMLATQFQATVSAPAAAADLTRKDYVDAQILTRIATALIGAANGVAPLDATSKIAATYLPSYVDDVLEYAALGNFPATGETGKIYTATGTNKVYRWSGSAYIEIAASPGSTDAVTEGATNKYYTDARAQAALSSALGLKAPLAAPALTGAATLDGQAIVKTNDSRLSDARSPLGSVPATWNAGVQDSANYGLTPKELRDATVVAIGATDPKSSIGGKAIVVTDDSRLSNTRAPSVGTSPYDISLPGAADFTTRAVGYNDCEIGVKLQRNVTFSAVEFRGLTADASGNTVAEIRKNGTVVSGTSTTVPAANQVAGVRTTGTWAFAKGDILTIYITGVGTTPGRGFVADLEGLA